MAADVGCNKERAVVVLLVKRCYKAVLDLAAGYGGIASHCTLDDPGILLYSHLLIQETLLHKGARLYIDTAAYKRLLYNSVVAYGGAACRTGADYALLHPGCA